MPRFCNILRCHSLSVDTVTTGERVCDEDTRATGHSIALLIALCVVTASQRVWTSELRRHNSSTIQPLKMCPVDTKLKSLLLLESYKHCRVILDCSRDRINGTSGSSLYGIIYKKNYTNGLFCPSAITIVIARIVFNCDKHFSRMTRCL